MSLYRQNPSERTKERARRGLAKAVKQGSIERRPCEECGASSAEGHHEDYSKPLEVRWLCPLHHRAVHKRQAA